MAHGSDISPHREPEARPSEQKDSSGAFVHLAEAYRQEGLLDDAIRICREGLASFPTYAGARVVLGQSLLEQGAVEEAEAEFGMVLLLAPEHPVANQCLGDIFAQQGQWEKARACYERVLTTNPHDQKTKAKLAALPRATAPALTAEGPPSAGTDPIASATLAGLYAAQGHIVEAEAIYAQLDRLPDQDAPPPVSPEIGDRAGSEDAVMSGLASFLEAARRARRSGRPTR